MKAIQQILNIFLAIEIDVRIRLVIASQKFLDAKGVERMAGANQNQVTDSASDQLQSAKNIRAQKDVAQLTIGLDEVEQIFAFYLDQLARFGCSYSCKRAPS